MEDLSKQNGFRPNVQVYTCLVQACFHNRRLDRALELHERMLADASCRFDEKFYAVLARGCLQMRQPLKAVKVVRAAYQWASAVADMSSAARAMGCYTLGCSTPWHELGCRRVGAHGQPWPPAVGCYTRSFSYR